MDLYYTFKSIWDSKINKSKIHVIFDEPIKIVDNVFYCNIYNLNNYSIIRDYNFKNIIIVKNLLDTETALNKTNSEFKYDMHNKDITTYHNIDLNINTPNDISNIIELINKLQLEQDYDSELEKNMIIYSESIDIVYLIIMSLMIKKYNYTIKKSIRYVEKKFNLNKNTIKFDIKTLELLKKI
jgi:hypothetical protein